MEEIITKDNLNTYTLGLKGVLSSMGEAILNGSGSSEDIAYIKNVVDDIYDILTDYTTYLSVTITPYTGTDIGDYTVTCTDTTLDATILPLQDGRYPIPTGHSYSVSVNPTNYIPYVGLDTTTFTGIAQSHNQTVGEITYENMPEYVDMGNGVKWATGNLTKSANSVYSIAELTARGAYFSWGGIDGHRVSGQVDSYNFSSTNFNKTSAKSLSYSFTSGDPKYDAARARLGSPWRVPTQSEILWLIDNCTWNYKSVNSTGYNGVVGYEVVGTNGNKIFLPFAGYYSGTSFTGSNIGYYWSTEYANTDYAYYLYAAAGTRTMSAGNQRWNGLCIRPVL